MREKCLAAFKEIFPNMPESEAMDVLLEFTAFPFATPEETRDQLLQLKADGFGPSSEPLPAPPASPLV